MVLEKVPAMAPATAFLRAPVDVSVRLGSTEDEELSGLVATATVDRSIVVGFVS